MISGNNTREKKQQLICVKVLGMKTFSSEELSAIFSRSASEIHAYKHHHPQEVKIVMSCLYIRRPNPIG